MGWGRDVQDLPDGGDYVAAATYAAWELRDYGHGNVPFNDVRGCASVWFRLDRFLLRQLLKKDPFPGLDYVMDLTSVPLCLRLTEALDKEVTFCHCFGSFCVRRCGSCHYQMIRLA